MAAYGQCTSSRSLRGSALYHLSPFPGFYTLSFLSISTQHCQHLAIIQSPATLPASTAIPGSASRRLPRAFTAWPPSPSLSTKVSPQRSTTYYYFPKTNELVRQSPAYEYVTVARPRSSTPPLTNASTRTSTPSPATPPTKMARTARVDFNNTVRARRAAREDELAVMRTFARHASRCDACYNPYQTWKEGGQLCDRGFAYARDVAKYIYSKGGIPHSMIDREVGERTEIELPVDCLVVRDLTKAFDKGLSLRSRKPVVSHDPNYYVPDRRSAHFVDDRGYGVEIKPHSSKSSRREREHYYRDIRDKPTIVMDKRGSLYYLDEEAKQSHKRYDEDPLVIIAEPRRRYKR